MPLATTMSFAPKAKIFEHVTMSLYYVQKLLYQLNRDARIRLQFAEDFNGLIADFDLSSDELEAVRAPDLGYLYVMGVNGQILAHYAGLHGIAWPDYIEALRDGLRVHGPVRDGVYADTGYEGVESHTAAILARRGGKA